MQRPDDVSLRKARANLRSLSSGGASQIPSLSLSADSLRLQLEKRGKVAILYVNLERYGRLEAMFGWHVVVDILDAIGASLKSMAGETLRLLDVISDLTLTDNAYVVFLSPPRDGDAISDDDLAIVMRRVHERLQLALLSDLPPGVYDRVLPTVGTAVLSSDDALTFEQSLEHGVASAMQAADEHAASYAELLERMLVGCIERGELEALFEPVVDAAAEVVIGYRSTVRGPFHLPIRLPDVLVDVARRASLVIPYGAAARSCAVRSAVGMSPDHLLFHSSAAAEFPNAAVVALSEFYALNPALVPQHVVFDLNADDLSFRTASTVRSLAGVREMGFQLCLSGVGVQLTSIALIAEARPDFLCLDPTLLTNLGADQTATEIIQLLVRFSDRIGAQLIATEVRDAETLRLLKGSGLELFSGEFFASPDTHPPAVTFKR